MVLSFLMRWLRPRIFQRTDLRFVMVTRKICPLCDKAWQVLTEYQSLYGFNLEKIDVDTDPDLATRYADCVPVVLINGKLRFRGAVNTVLLERILNARQDL
jgi:glutaredoxin